MTSLSCVNLNKNVCFGFQEKQQKMIHILYGEVKITDTHYHDNVISCEGSLSCSVKKIAQEQSVLGCTCKFFFNTVCEKIALASKTGKYM
jgi:hypothetical protein